MNAEPVLLCPRLVSSAEEARKRLDPEAAEWKMAPEAAIPKGHPEEAGDTGAMRVRGLWDPEAWHLRIAFRGAGAVGLAFDPEGDDASFFEVVLTATGEVLQAVCRRNRSGFRKHPGFAAPGVEAAVTHRAEETVAVLRLPFGGFTQRRPPAPWRGAFRYGEGILWPPFREIRWG